MTQPVLGRPGEVCIRISVVSVTGLTPTRLVYCVGRPMETSRVDALSKHRVRHKPYIRHPHVRRAV